MSNQRTQASLVLSKQRGLSLIEVIVSAIILAAALLALARLQSDFLQASSQTRLQAAALNYAQEKLEELRDFDVAKKCTDYPSPPNPTSSTRSTSGADFARSWEFTDCVPSGAECRRINVEVSWPDSTGASPSVTLSSQIACTEPMYGGVYLSN